MAVKHDGKKRLLFYNWAQFDDADGLGGGVSVYLSNLLDALSRRQDLEIFFLSAGVLSEWLDRRVRWRETGNVYAERGVRSFAIVNSPVKAPARAMFHDIGTWQSDTQTRDVFRDFLVAHGPFDAVHIHNLEGLSSAALAVASEFPESRFYFTWHNYIPVCPQVHLLYGDDKPCLDYADGRNCVTCVAPRHGKRLAGRMFLGNSQLAGRDAGDGGVIGDADGPATHYKAWRETNLALLNDVFDGTIAVSPLVKETVVSLGAKPEAVEVVPLGMDVHATPNEMKAAWKAKPKHDAFTFSFVGYSGAYKGLPFLAEALEGAQDAFLKEDTDLIIVARMGWRDRRLVSRLKNLFRQVTLINGYDRRQLPDIARQIDVNIAPSIWRETFHQVGYELLCTGTPSILSSSVGLRMFYQNKPDFEFEAGNHADLVGKMTALACHRENVAAFWNTPVCLPSMQEHADALLRILLGD